MVSEMSSESKQRLLVMIAHERADRLAQVTAVVTGLGHEVIERKIGIIDVGQATIESRPDVAIVIVGHDSELQALRSIDTIVKEASCPVIAILDVQDRAFINEAAKRGIFAYIADGQDPDELQSSIDIVLRRFAEYHALEGAFGRRAVTERAKGILMERHGIDEQAAFNMLREHARRHNRKMVEVAEEVVDTHQLLPGAAQSSPPRHFETPD
jgi:AmiR/NasT family two-component response regulator